MPTPLTHPGVYIEEVPSGVRTIAGAATSTTAFVDVFRRGPVGEAIVVASMADVERTFGGLDDRSESSYGLSQYFLNGGRSAVVVRIAPDAATPASGTVGGLGVEAVDPGAWGNSIDVSVVVHDGDINLELRHHADGAVERTERFHDLDTGGGRRDVRAVVGANSDLVRITSVAEPVTTSDAPIALTGGNDGLGPHGADDRAEAIAVVAAALSRPDGLDALTHVDTIGLLALPATAFMSANDRQSVLAQAAAFCEARRIFLITDPPADAAPTDFVADPGAAVTHLSANAALWYPALTIPDLLDANRPRVVAPSGTIAGVIARTDGQRGVWKAPAGLAASIRGASPRFDVSRADLDRLNPRGLNTIRTFAGRGTFSWGARTLHGADSVASEWKYVPVRRTALFIESSLSRGLRFAVFEPNDEPLWAQIRGAVDTFLQQLFRSGAFAGSTSEESFFVRCGADTTTRADIDDGVVNVVVGFAPLKPAEFVIVQLRLPAGR